MSMKNSNYTIGNRNRDLPVYSAGQNKTKTHKMESKTNKTRKQTQKNKLENIQQLTF
jgi:hypothetical protein